MTDIYIFCGTHGDGTRIDGQINRNSISSESSTYISLIMVKLDWDDVIKWKMLFTTCWYAFILLWTFPRVSTRAAKKKYEMFLSKAAYRISNNKKKKLEKNGKKERKKENTYVYQADTETCDPTIATVWSNFSYVFLHLVNLSLSTKLAVAAMIIDLSSSDFDWMTNKTFWFFITVKWNFCTFCLQLIIEVVEIDYFLVFLENWFISKVLNLIS